MWPTLACFLPHCLQMQANEIQLKLVSNPEGVLPLLSAHSAPKFKNLREQEAVHYTNTQTAARRDLPPLYSEHVGGTNVITSLTQLTDWLANMSCHGSTWFSWNSELFLCFLHSFYSDIGSIPWIPSLTLPQPTRLGWDGSGFSHWSAW